MKQEAGDRDANRDSLPGGEGRSPGRHRLIPRHEVRGGAVRTD